MENQDETVRRPDEIIAGNALANTRAKDVTDDESEPAGGITSAGDRLLYGKPHPDGAARAAAGTHAEGQRLSGAETYRGAIVRNPLGTIALAVAAGLLLGRILL